MSAAKAIELLRALVAFDTTSRNSNLLLIEHVKSYLAKHGVTSELLFDSTRRKANLVARIGTGEGGILLSGHSDVVPVDGQDWHTPPFELTEKDGRLYGRGTADMKSFIAVCLALVPGWAKNPPSAPIYLAISYDEEVGCLGAPAIAEYMKTHSLRPQLAIIGEPTLMQPICAHKGIRSFETIVTGLEAHSSDPRAGVNAVMVAAELIHFLNKLAAEYTEKGKKNESFSPPYTTIHVGVVQGGTARNIIPKSCKFLWEVRPLPEEDVEAILTRFNRKAAELDKQIKTQHAEAGIVTRPLSRVAGLKPEATPLESKLMHLLNTNSMQAVSFCTEAGIFQESGIPAIICGPGSIEQAHKPNEYIDIPQISTCVEFLTALVEQ